MRIIHIGHHFFGAGNFGDDLILAGFLSCLGPQLQSVRISCSCPHDLASQKKRFPSIEWLEYTPELRREAVRRADAWLGLGGSPFQSDGSNWFTNHLLEEAELCGESGVPMWYLGVGVNNESVLHRAEVRGLVDRAEHIWARDPRSMQLIRAHSKNPHHVSLGSDLANCFLSGRSAKFEPRKFGLSLNFHDDPARHLAEIEGCVDLAAGYERCWLIQEVRDLPYSERRTFSLLSARAREILAYHLPDYSAATVEDLISAWPACAMLLSSRYHATLIHAWAGSRIGVISINDKLQAVADDLGLPSFQSIADFTAETLEETLCAVPREVLDERDQLARSSVVEWLQHGLECSHPKGLQVKEKSLKEKNRLKTLSGTKRICILCSDSLGDIVLRQPLFRALVENGYEVTVAARPDCIPLLPYMDHRLQSISIDFDSYHLGTLPEYAEAILLFLDRVRACAIDAIVCPLFNRTIADEAVLTSFPELIRVGFTPGIKAVISIDEVFGPSWPAHGRPAYFSHAVPAVKEWHETKKCMKLLMQAFGIELAEYAPVLTLTKEAIGAAKQVLVDFGLSSKKYAISCPIGGANVQLKAIPDSLSIEVARFLAKEARLPLLFVGIESERSQLEHLKEMCSFAGADAHVWIGDARRLGCLLGLTSEARLYFGSDTGPMHMAGALGIPVAAVMGGGTYPRFLPVARKVFVALNKLECFGCDWRCKFEEPFCITSLKPESVIEGVRHLILQ